MERLNLETGKIEKVPNKELTNSIKKIAVANRFISRISRASLTKLNKFFN